MKPSLMKYPSSTLKRYIATPLAAGAILKAIVHIGKNYKIAKK